MASANVRPTFVTYSPLCAYQVEHPGDVVETLSLSSVNLHCPKYEHSIPDVLILSDKPSLSAVQMDAILLAGAAHTKGLGSLNPSRLGFLIGDGTGLGKGRELLGIILDNWYKGRKKALWVSSSPLLIQDAKRDLKDLLNPLKGNYHDHRPRIKILEMPDHYDSIYAEDGVLFCTYATLSRTRDDVESEVVYKPKFSSRLDQVMDFLGGKDFNGVVVFDEAHRAKGYSETSPDSSRVGDSVVTLQEKLPKARIVYVSATIASTVKDMEFMVRLGLWGARHTGFQSSGAFFNFVENRGKTGSEIVACEMKSRGIYCSRHLSYSSCSFEMKKAKVTPEFLQLYDKCSDIWMKIIILCDKKLRSQMWATCQKFFKALCISSKLPTLFDRIRRARDDEKAVVVGIQSTGEAAYEAFRTSKYHNEKDLFSPCRLDETYLESFLLNYYKFAPVELGLITKRGQKSSKSSVVLGGIRKSNPPPEKKHRMENYEVASADDNEFNDNPAEGNLNKNDDFETVEPTEAIPIQIVNAYENGSNDDDFVNTNPLTRRAISSLFKEICEHLPLNPLDLICAEFGYMNVSEMTGRGAYQTLVRKSDSSYQAGNEAVRRKDALQIAHEAFQEGYNQIAIISEAASTGISLHSSRTCANQSQRVHILLEAPWSAMSTCQQFGRTMRSNQAVPPMYIILMSAIPAERRFATSLACRMGNLGALCKGDRKSSHGTLWSEYDVCFQAAKKAIKNLLNTISTRDVVYKFFNSPEDHERRNELCRVLMDIRVLKYLKNDLISPESSVLNHDTFLNRVLCMKIGMQTEILDLLDAAMIHHKNTEERSVEEMKDLSDEINASFEQQETFVFKLGSNLSSTLLTFQKMDLYTWEDVTNETNGIDADKFRFYAKKLSSGRFKVCVCIKQKSGNVVEVYRPSTKNSLEKPLQHLKRKGYQIVDKNRALELWAMTEKWFRSGKCSGSFRGTCNGRCEHKKPCLKFGVAVGGLLSIWNNIDSITDSYCKFVRYHEGAKQFVGIFIDEQDIESCKVVLSEFEDEYKKK